MYNFDERKAAQAAACLLHWAGGSLPALKLLRLMYLAERRSLRRYGEQITGDRFVSMPYGPVLSMTLGHINGEYPARVGGWSTWIAGRADHEVGLRDAAMLRTPEQDLPALSACDLECLGDTWKEFGHWDQSALSQHSQSGACPEWKDAQGGGQAIAPGRIFNALRFARAQLAALTQRLRAQRNPDAIFC